MKTLPRLIKLIIFLLLFGIIFEAGLLSSYTIVTAKSPNIGNVIGMQVNDVTSILGNMHKSTLKTYNVTNTESVSSFLQNKTGLTGIDCNSLSAAAVSTHSNTLNVTLTATGYKDNQTTANTTNSAFTSGQIVITPAATYNITATASATLDEYGVNVDINTIKITALQQIINQ